MKKIILFVVLLAAFSSGEAQDVPAGMKYQAVARNSAGELLPNRTLSLQVQLKGRPAKGSFIYYIEEHTVTTNQLGLFDLVVGEGIRNSGSFNEIPWSTTEIWMAVSLKENDKAGYSAVSENRLLAVPYAFHALSASRVTGGKGDVVNGANSPGVPANVWSLKGNSGINPLVDRLGTTDNQDLVMITNNIERFRITKEGDINIANSLKVGLNVEVGNDLIVKKNVFLNTLSGSTTNNGSFTVANQSATSLTGTLTVDGDGWLKSKLRTDNEATFKNKVIIDNPAFGSTSSATGALVVAGGVGIGQNLYLNNHFNAGGNAQINGNTLINGNAGIGSANPNAKLNISSPSSVLYPIYAEVTGGSNRFSMNSDGQLYLRSTKAGTSDNNGNYAMTIDGQNQGLVIKLNEKSHPGNDNHYITFAGSTNTVHGRIEGQTLDELHSSFEYIWFHAMEAVGTALGAAMVIVDLAGVDDFDAAVVDGLELIANVAKWVEAAVQLETNIGITYESGSGDYAEWLKKTDVSEKFSFGDIVGVKGGQISKSLTNADHYLVVSMSPIVLGNMPRKGHEADYEKIAFMGQVPVKVRGLVSKGDYIIASTQNDGTGIAVHPSAMQMEQYKRIVGVAWSEASSGDGYSLVNVAIGINTNSLVDKISQQQNEINKLNGNMNAIAVYLKEKDPLFKMPDIEPEILVANPEKGDETVSRPLPDINTMDNNQIRKILLNNRELISDVLENAKIKLAEMKINFDKYPKIARLLNDTDYFIESFGKNPSTFR